jgi:hypothetical protein
VEILSFSEDIFLAVVYGKEGREEGGGSGSLCHIILVSGRRGG